MEKSIKVFAPASVSNVGCGFDTLGFAIDKPGDIIIVKHNKLNKVRITKITGDRGKLPKIIEHNTASVSLVSMLKALKSNAGFDIEIRKNMPLSSGLGSSAASAVGSVVALNELLDKPFSKNQLLDFALLGEAISSGTIHADNVAPSLLGGFILIRDYEPVDVIRIPIPGKLFCTIIYPHISINTGETRKLIKKTIPLKKARKHFGNVGALIAGLYNGDFALIGRSIVDEISEPARKHLINGYSEIKYAAIKAGAVACNISGSGPSLFAFSDSKSKAEKIGAAMQKVVERLKIKSTVYISKINSVGTKVLN